MKYNNQNTEPNSLPELLYRWEWLLIFLMVFLSRIFTAIYYIEEPDSLRFALAIQEFDIVKLQPHFPGYPVFCWFAQSIFLITNSMGITFAIIGGISISAIIYALVSIYILLSKAFSRTTIYVIIALMFFNPLLWILSTSYMPDCMGAALVCIIIMFACRALKFGRINDIFAVQLLTGILCGTRLSYIPFVIIPGFYLLMNFPKKFLQLIAGIAGVLIWLIPLILVTGFPELVNAAQTHTDGHFTDWGGSYITENNLFLRLEMLLRGIWADGTGLYWSGRNLVTIISSFSLIIILIFAVQGKENHKEKNLLLIISGSAILYLVWILFGQNVIYKARHVLPLLPFFLLFLMLGINHIIHKKIVLLFIVIFLGSYSYTGTIMAFQHTKPTAISQSNAFIKNNIDSKNAKVVSIGLVNDYLRVHGVESELINVSSPAEISHIQSIFPEHEIWYVGIDPGRKISAKTTHHFYHNPYVNRMWPVIEVIKL